MRHIKIIAPLFLGVLLVSALAGFLVTTATRATPSTASAVSSYPWEKIVDTIEEAEELAGYKASVPKILPDGYVPLQISVQAVHENIGPEITQLWRSTRDFDESGQPSIIKVQQIPKLKGIAQGQPAEIRGQTGQRAFYPAGKSGRTTDLVSFYWQQDGMGYSVSGTLIGSTTEDDIKRVVESIETQ